MNEANKAYGLLLGGCKICKHFWDLSDYDFHMEKYVCRLHTVTYKRNIHHDEYFVYLPAECKKQKMLAAPIIENLNDACGDFDPK